MEDLEVHLLSDSIIDQYRLENCFGSIKQVVVHYYLRSLQSNEHGWKADLTEVWGFVELDHALSWTRDSTDGPLGYFSEPMVDKGWADFMHQK